MVRANLEGIMDTSTIAQFTIELRTMNNNKFTLVKLLDAELWTIGTIGSTAPWPLILNKRMKAEEQRATEFMLY